MKQKMPNSLVTKITFYLVILKRKLFPTTQKIAQETM